MALTNYRDVSRSGSDLGAGFQFEFRCGRCASSWKSPMQPYRRGQFAGLIYGLARWFGDRGSMSRATSVVASAGEARAKEGALEEALALAEQRYWVCPSCNKEVCENCWDARAGRCEQCQKENSHSPVGAGTSAGGGMSCPNCSSALGGGRFCPECGYDMASTHKSCPNCGAMCARATRFCTDCGHGF